MQVGLKKTGSVKCKSMHHSDSESRGVKRKTHLKTSSPAFELTDVTLALLHLFPTSILFPQSSALNLMAGAGQRPEGERAWIKDVSGT